MAEFLSLLKTLAICGSLLAFTMIVLLSLPASRLRAVALEVTKWLVVSGLVLLTFSPLDLLPGLPVDDAVYIIAAILTGRSALKDREARKLFEEIELQELRGRAGRN